MNQLKLRLKKVQSTSKRVCFLSFLLSMTLLLACLSACAKDESPNDNYRPANRNSEAVTNDINGDDEQNGGYTANGDQTVANISVKSIYDIQDGIGVV